jgi:WD40 repeat protein
MNSVFPLLTMGLTPDGRTLATADSARKATFWNVSDPAHPIRRATLSTSPGPGRGLAAAFSRDGRTMAAAELGLEGVRLTDVTNPAKPSTLAVLPTSIDSIGTMAFSPDGRTLAMGTEAQRVFLWDLTDKRHPKRLPAPVESIQSRSPIAFSSDGNTLAFGDGFGKIMLLDVTNRSAPRRLAALAGYNYLVTVAFSPDGRTLAAGGLEKAVSLWDVAIKTKPRRLATLTDRTYSTSVAFSPDGRSLAVGVGYDEVRIWDISDRNRLIRLASYRGPRLGTGQLIFSRDRNTLVAGNSFGQENTTITLLDFAGLNEVSADPAGHTCAITGQGLSASEWKRYIPEFPHQRTCSG